MSTEIRAKVVIDSMVGTYLDELCGSPLPLKHSAKYIRDDFKDWVNHTGRWTDGDPPKKKIVYRMRSFLGDPDMFTDFDTKEEAESEAEHCSNLQDYNRYEVERVEIEIEK